jgi:UDP-glucose 4-epimerase
LISDQIKFIPERPGEAKETLANMKKMLREFDWKPNNKIESYITENLK